MAAFLPNARCAQAIRCRETRPPGHVAHAQRVEPHQAGAYEIGRDGIVGQHDPPKMTRVFWSQRERRQRNCRCILNASGIFDQRGETVARHIERRRDVRPHVLVRSGGEDYPCQAVSRRALEDKSRNSRFPTADRQGARGLGSVHRGFHFRGSKRTSTSVSTLTGRPPRTVGL